MTGTTFSISDCTLDVLEEEEEWRKVRRWEEDLKDIFLEGRGEGPSIELEAPKRWTAPDTLSEWNRPGERNNND